MKLLFSEAQSDYQSYVFPYAIWAIPEPGEPPGEFFARGFLPASRELDRFYLCRNVRIRLPDFHPSSENRRILRKGAGIAYELVPRRRFRYTENRRAFFKTYADIKFGKDVMTYARLDAIFKSRIVSHLLVYTDEATGREVGVVTLFLDPPRLAYYYFAFYDLNYYARKLGIYMMTTAVDFFAREGFEYLHLGSVYSRNALYKTQFAGMEFFNGFEWADDLAQLKYLIQRDARVYDHHLLESADFLGRFYDGDLAKPMAGALLSCPLNGA